VIYDSKKRPLDALQFEKMNVTDPHDVMSGLVLAGPPKELLQASTFLLKRVGFAARDSAHGAFEGTGLSPVHFAVLALLEEDPRETQAVIADALGYDRSHLVRLLDELEERELVVRKRDPDDRRRHVVKLTPEGTRALARLRDVVAALETDFLAPLDAEDRETLLRLLLRLAGHHDPRCAPRGPR
jgi:MarR family transcriptional regulator, lower aerobic nicotinate degradation pathway regulator